MNSPNDKVNLAKDSDDSFSSKDVEQVDLEIPVEDKEELWKKTGFQRILGGYWHNYIFVLGTMVFGLLILGVLFPNYILPFPEALGFRSVVTSLFALMFTIFDVGIGSAVTRFVAEFVGVGKIKKGLSYVRFFIWFQMFTGLIQVTAIAVWGLHWAPEIKEFSSLVWMFLIYSTVQFPGMLGIFKSVLSAFQRFDKVNIVTFVQTVLLESSTQIGFIFLGRWWGVNNPQFGELMGATLGYILGLYIDDFLAMMLSAKFFSDILEEYNITFWETLVPEFDKKTVVRATKFGLKNMAQGIFYQISMLMITGMTIAWLPNYATIVGLFSIADGVTRVVIQDLPAKAAISESYNNGKIALTKYYTTATFKCYGILTFFLAVEIVQLVPSVISTVAGNYASAAWMIAPLMVSRFFIGPIHFSDSVHQGCDKPEYAAYSLAVQMIGRAISFWILLSPKALPSLIPNYNLALAYVLADFPSVIAKNIFAWWIVDRKLFKVKINWWQTIIAPALSTLPLFAVNRVLLYFFNTYFRDNPTAAIIYAICILIFLIFGIPTLVFFPTLGFFGGWDERGLRHLKEAAEISGPSKPITMMLYKGAKFGFDHSPLREFGQEHKIPYKSADREAKELFLLRRESTGAIK